MKKVILFLSGTLLFMSIGFSQTTFTADLKGTKADLDAAINKGLIAFDVINLKGQNDVDLMLNKSVPYKKEIAIAITLQKSTGQVLATVNDGIKDMKWLYRFFLNAGISNVQFGGKTLTTQEFFQPWM